MSTRATNRKRKQTPTQQDGDDISQTTSTNVPIAPKRAKHGGRGDAAVTSTTAAEDIAMVDTAPDEQTEAAAAEAMTGDAEEAQEEEDEADDASATKAASRKKATGRKKKSAARKPVMWDATLPATKTRQTLVDGSSPVSKCDNNTLSLVLAQLNSRDFAAAMKVSRQWHAVSALNTAWPRFGLGRFIRQLQSDDYDNPAHRRLNVRSATKMVRSVAYKKANDVRLRQKVFELLPLLTSFPHLTALTCECPGYRDASRELTALFGELQDRLQVLILSGLHSRFTVLWGEPPKNAPTPDLALLRQLRVLVVDFVPRVEHLVELRQLQYLHIRHPGTFTPAIVRAVRYLSVRHALRGVSLAFRTRAAARRSGAWPGAVERPRSHMYAAGRRFRGNLPYDNAPSLAVHYPRTIRGDECERGA